MDYYAISDVEILSSFLHVCPDVYVCRKKQMKIPSSVCLSFDCDVCEHPETKLSFEPPLFCDPNLFHQPNLDNMFLEDRQTDTNDSTKITFAGNQQNSATQQQQDVHGKEQSKRRTK